MTATTQPAPALESGHEGAQPRERFWTVVTAVEVIAASAAILLDLLIPTFILLALAGISLRARRERVASLGFHRAPSGSHLAFKMLAFAAVWSVFQLSVTMPIANHLSGKEQDLSAFKDLQGNAGLLVGFVALSWTLAAVGEELAYRGYLQTRMTQLFSSRRVGLIFAVLASSLLFGIAHSEQGVVGVAIVTIDAIAFSVVRYRYRTLWASVLAHGFNNTIGFVAFFLVGPIHGFW
jgi:membrane protease YdiL (CAAX protease family)